MGLIFSITGFLPYPFKHLNSHLIVLNIGIRPLLFETLEFRPYTWDIDSDLFVSSIKICTLSFQTLECPPYPCKYWNSHLLFRNSEILTSSFQSLEFASYYPFKHWNSYLILETLQFWRYPLKLWNKHLFYSKQWNSQLFLTTIGIRTLSF